jgi:hypothetical protein
MLCKLSSLRIGERTGTRWKGKTVDGKSCFHLRCELCRRWRSAARYGDTDEKAVQLQAAKDGQHVVILSLENCGSIASRLMNARDLGSE